TAERLFGGTDRACKLLELGDDPAGAFDGVDADRGQQHTAFSAIDQRRFKDAFQFLQARAERGLGDVTGIRGPSEMRMISKRHQMAKLSNRRQVFHDNSPASESGDGRRSGTPTRSRLAIDSISYAFIPVNIDAFNPGDC